MFPTDDLASTLFRESGLKDGSELLMKEVKQVKATSGDNESDSGEEEEVEVEGEEDEMIEGEFGESADEEMEDPDDGEEVVSGEMY